MATAPDAGRFGTAFPDKNGNWVLLTGNQMGGFAYGLHFPFS